MSALDQQRANLAVANSVLGRRTVARRAIVTGERSVVEVLADQDPDVAGMLLPDLLLLAPLFGRSRLRTLGRRAARDRVNLLVTLGEAPVGTRAWLVRELAQVLPYERKAAAA